MSTAEEITAYWDAAAESFDQEPDHGLAAAGTRTAWARRLAGWLPDAPGGLDVLDLGCGTGSLSLLAAAAGHRVVGVDLSPRMVAHARAKFATAGLAAGFLIGDAAAPPVGGRRFDVVLARHLLWTLPEPERALRHWAGLLRPGGRLVLVEGRWRQSDPGSASAAGYVSKEGALPWHGGVGADELAAAIRPLAPVLRIEPLSGEPELWGRAVDDERYALVAELG
ncbi:class I SAM-dependent methyltransferase [Kitasatospora sp. NPDC002227]|uniref:class I SAM-dependent methyltransferase n=1 Tax=Kitasatospora sp. NPDC002227 TaxID=3154773 RepID=UPI003322E2CF